MEIWDYEALENEVDKKALSPDEIAERLAYAAFAILTPMEAAVMFALYEGKNTAQIAAANNKTVRAINLARVRLAKKLEVLFCDVLQS